MFCTTNNNHDKFNRYLGDSNNITLTSAVSGGVDGRGKNGSSRGVWNEIP